MAEDENNNPQPNPADDAQKAQGSQTSDNQYNVEVEKIKWSAVGTNATLNVSNDLDAISKFIQDRDRSLEKIIEVVIKAGQAPGGLAHLGSKLGESLKSGGDEVKDKSEEDKATATIKGVVEFPLTIDDFEKWYDGQDDYGRCFIQVAAALNGAPLRKVSEAADDLHQSSQEAQQRQHVMAPQNSHAADSLAYHATRPSSRRKLFASTYTTAVRSNSGVERVFWDVANAPEQQAITQQQIITLRILRFIAGEASISYGGLRFSDMLEQWAEQMKGECSKKAARALGIVLYHQDVDELWRTSNAWANSAKPGDWRLAANALSGAYEVDLLEDEQQANDTSKSHIFRLLNQWVERAEDARNPRVGCAAAITYGLISRKVPDIALNGLERLLCFPESDAGTSWESIALFVWVESISNYVYIARSGQIRKALDHLARCAEMLIYQRQRPAKMSEREAYRGRCRLNLEAIYESFFLITLSSLAGARNDASVEYSLTEPLPDYPEIPGDGGQDVLLVAILSSEELRLHNCLATLLCAAIFAGKHREACFFMRQWANIVLCDTSEQREQLQTAYAEFVIGVGQMVQKWEKDPAALWLGQSLAFRKFTYQLGLWVDRRNPGEMETFVQSILAALQ